jgi:hypothetical protein
LAEYALTFDPLLLGKIAQRIRVHVDPDGSLRSEEAAVEARELTISRQDDGMYRVRGRLDAEAAGTVMKALSPLAAPKAAVDGVKDLRRGARRSADALVELAQRALKAGKLPRNGGQRPQLIVSVAYETLVGTLDRAGVPVLDNGEPITAEAARRLACDGEIVPVVLGGKSQPLDVGRKKRVVPPHIRRALTARDGGCVFPACDRPPDWSEAHHIVHWLHGGDTDVDNTTLLCGFHHGVVHAQGWEIVMIDGHPHFIPPRWLDADRTPRRNHMRRPGRSPNAQEVRGGSTASAMASAGQISTHSPHDVHAWATTTGRDGAGRRARSGQVNRQAPHAVQAALMVKGLTVRGSPTGSPSA